MNDFPEQIYEETSILPALTITMTIDKHENIGEGVVRVLGRANGLCCKRLTQESYGHMVNEVPVWSIEDRIVATWFAEQLEYGYQQLVKNQTVIIQ